ncbi:hypothetical protein CR157_05685 [Halomonas sp. LBP4]|nr:hypothetical protein CR157_05685 [Halomonas sp. LBP4]
MLQIALCSDIAALLAVAAFSTIYFMFLQVGSGCIGFFASLVHRHDVIPMQVHDFPILRVGLVRMRVDGAYFISLFHGTLLTLDGYLPV